MIRTTRDIRDAILIVDGAANVTNATLGSADVSSLLDHYFPNGTLTISTAAIVSAPSDDFVRVRGAVRVIGVDIDATARFYLKDGRAQLDLDGPLPAGWRFADSFASLQRSHLNDFILGKPAVRLTSEADAAGRHGLWLNAEFRPAPVWEALKWFADPGDSAGLSGQVNLDRGEPVMTLSVSPSIHASLGGYLSVDLRMEHLAQTYTNPRDPEKPVVSTVSRLSGAVSFNHEGKVVEVPIAVHFSTDLSVLNLRLSTDEVFDVGLSAIAHWFNGLDLAGEGLPDFYRPATGLTLHDVDFAIGVRTRKLEYINMSLQSTAPWTVIDGMVVIERVGIDFMVLTPASSAEVRATITGRLKIAGVELDIYAQVPDFQIKGALAEGSAIDLSPLIDHLAGTSQGVPSTLKIDQLSFEAHPSGGFYSFAIDVTGDWEIVSGLVLTGLSTGITYERASDDSQVAVSFQALLRIAGIDVYLRALYDQGWQFEGSTDQEIPIGELLIDLGEKFGVGSDHPACLESLKFKNLDVRFNTATRDFTFKGEADFKIEDRDVSIEVLIDISHQSDGSAQKRFSGVIRIGTNEFDVVFADRKATLEGSDVEISMLVAAYQSTAGAPPGIRDLVPIEYKQRVPDISTRGAFLAKQWSKTQGADTTTATSKWLLGLSLEAGLDLSNVKLPDLPLMGSGGPPKSLKLDLQVLVATEKFDESEVGIIAGLNATGGVSVPKQAVDGVAVATVLLMDGETVTLNLPIKANPNPAQGQAAFDRSKPLSPPGQVSTGAGAVPAVALTPGVAVAPDDTKWVKIQKNFGPIHVERVGLKYQDEKLFIFLDGGLTAAGFTVSLEGLGVDTPLTEFKPHFNLSGIGIDYKGGAVELGGAFLQQEMADSDEPGKTYTAYAGEAVLRTEKLSLSAIGSFFKYRGESSLFIYALLEYPLGGPPFFFVTGLAAGFGYNRRAIVPPVEQIHTYPLVTKAIAGPVTKSGTATAEVSSAVAKTALAAELAALEAYVPPELGEIFLAVGVKFTSFKLIDSFALIIAQFGAHNQFDLVGVSHLQIPSKEASGATGSLLAEIYMNWKAVFSPEEGVVGLKAVMAPGSYVFSPDCQLTGGFAYYAWFGGEHAGDFVYTLGGYHPEFHKPDHYPVVPRLAFNWIVKEANLHLKGELYYALTGHAFMAGGKLDASIHGGFDIGIAGVDYSADLHIAADFLITWEPYHYDAGVSLDLSIDVSAHLLFFSTQFSLNVGGDMHIWGPEFAGQAHVYLKVLEISHTLDVTFGHGPPQLRPITWERFSNAFLPQTTQQGKDKETDKATTPIPAGPDPHAICGVSVKRGLIRSSGDRWVMNAKEFCLVTDSMIPSNQAKRGNEPLVAGNDFSDSSGEGESKKYDVKTDFGIAPMGVNPVELTTVHGIAIKRGSKNAEHFFRCEPVCKNVPAAMWDRPRFADPFTEEFLQKPELNPERQLVPGVLGGLEVLPAVLTHPSETLPVERRALQYETEPVADAYRWESIPAFEAAEHADWKKRITDTILKKKPTGGDSADAREPWKVREDILDELGLGREQVYFGHSVDQYVVDAPRIQM